MKIFKKIFIYMLILTFSLIVPFFNLKEVHAEKKLYDDNITSYETDKGTHNIYWAQGVTAPKMSSDKSLLGTEGYFDVEELNGYLTYSAEYEVGHGYYDLNKNFESRPEEKSLCYLATAGNMILWWLEQNKDLVDRYVNLLKTTDTFDQVPGLYPLKPFDQELWNRLLETPKMELQDGYLAQKLGTTPLAYEFLKPYYYKSGHGYWPQYVLDFFFNGYDAIPDMNSPEPNSPETMKKDPRGGFFYPIFNKDSIAEVIKGNGFNKYNVFGENLKQYFREGKAVGFSYEHGHLNGHALTIWGAEYDENDRLVRIFLTDSDDSQPSKFDDTYWRGLVGFQTHEDKHGNIAISNQINPDPNKPGNYIEGIYTLDLARDRFEERLNDLEGPKQPVIEQNLEDLVLPLNVKRELKITASLVDKGNLEYVWYEAEDKNSKGKIVQSGMNNTLKLDTSNIGVKYYYCVVQNIKNGKIYNLESNHISVEIANIEAVNADTPKVTFNTNTITVNQYQNKSIFVSASVKDQGVLTYQWYQANNNYAENGRLLKGETNPTLVIPTDKPSNGLYYYCVVTNTNLSVNGLQQVSTKTSLAKRIIVKESILENAAIPQITLQPQDLNLLENEKNASLEVNAISLDNGIISYKWYYLDEQNNRHLIENENDYILAIKTNIPGQYKVQCEVINTNENASTNKVASIFTNIININIKKEAILSDNNYLENIIISNGTLNPSFDKNIFEYSVTIPHQDNLLDLLPITNALKGFEIINQELQIGETKQVKIIVTAENNETRTYIINVTRSSEHDYSDWEIIKLPTCTETGLKRKTCSYCDHVIEEIIPALGHSFEDNWTIDVEPTCTRTGLKSHHCKNCDERIDETIIEKIPHEFEEEWTIDKEATCKEEGSKSHHCKYCDEKKDVTIIEKKEHSWSNWVKVKDPTETEFGIEQRVCENCGEIEERIIHKLPSPNKSGCTSGSLVIFLSLLFVSSLAVVIIKK